jgi:hypothetical protein
MGRSEGVPDHPDFTCATNVLQLGLGKVRSRGSTGPAPFFAHQPLECRRALRAEECSKFEQMTAPKRQLSGTRHPPTLDAILNAVGQVCSTMGASGAIVALSEPSGLRPLATAENVPGRAAELQLDSEFTRECLEADRVIFCDDARKDLRVRLDAAQLLSLRSAISVPIHFQGSLVGILQLFSSEPYTFVTAHAETLREVANLIAPLLASDSAVPALFVSTDPSSFSPPRRSKFHGDPAKKENTARHTSRFTVTPSTPSAPIPQPAPNPKSAPSAGPSYSTPRPDFSSRPARALASQLAPIPSRHRRESDLVTLRRFLFGTTFGRTLILGAAAACVVLLLYIFTHSAPTLKPTAAIPGASGSRVESLRVPKLPLPSTSPGKNKEIIPGSPEDPRATAHQAM